MDKEKVTLLQEFIKAYNRAADKPAFMRMWESLLVEEDRPLTLADAYAEAYGSALAQL